MRLPPALKRLTTPIAGSIPLPILGGENKGCRWSLASWGSGYGTGRREQAQMRMFAALIRPGDVVWDVGAHHGYVTLLAARQVGAHGRVHAFEPSERSRRLLQRHLRWNQVSNVTVEPYAIGSADGTARFGGGETSKQHRLGAGEETVEVRTMSTLLSSGERRRPNFLKVDVEGAEGQLLETGREVLPPAARMVIAVHSRAAYEQCAAVLRGAGFRIYESSRLERRKAGRWHGDADMIAFGPAYADYDRDMESIRSLSV